MKPLVTHSVNFAASLNEEVGHDGFDENGDDGGGDGDDNLTGKIRCWCVSMPRGTPDGASPSYSVGAP